MGDDQWVLIKLFKPGMLGDWPAWPDKENKQEGSEEQEENQQGTFHERDDTAVICQRSR
jgi:hypothetical protein